MITQEHLTELSKMGAVGMDVSKSCTILEIEEEEFYKSEEAQKAYRTGQLRGEFVYRQSVFKGAKDGIPQMCKLYQSLMEKTVLLNNPDLNMEEYCECEIEPEEIDNQRAGGDFEEGKEPESKSGTDSGDFKGGLPNES